MNVIKYEGYNPKEGTLFDLEEAKIYKKKHLYGAVNIPYDKLMANYKKILDKEKKYFIYCRKGVKSKKAISILEYNGYDVTQVINEWFFLAKIYWITL